MQHLNRAELSKEFLKLLASEIERWNHLAHMLETGEMTYLRMHLSRRSLRLPSDP